MRRNGQRGPNNRKRNVRKKEKASCQNAGNKAGKRRKSRNAQEKAKWQECGQPPLTKEIGKSRRSASDRFSPHF